MNGLFKDKLQKFQNRAARIIAGANYEVNSADVLDSLDWETLEERRIRNKSVLMYRILNVYTGNRLLGLAHCKETIILEIVTLIWLSQIRKGNSLKKF